MKKNQNNLLLCTFTKKHLVDKKILEIQSKFNIKFNRIYILDVINTSDVIITYNVILDYSDNYKDLIKNTISLHRKKVTNTLYTINAINEIIKANNTDIIDINYKIKWEDYSNSLLINEDEKLKIMKTKLLKIINIKRIGLVD